MGVMGRDLGCTEVIYQRERRFCNLYSCPAKSEEESEGVVLHFSDEDVKKVLDYAQLFYQTISDVVNSYCQENGAECCETFQNTNVNNRLGRSDVTSASNVYLASGFPKADLYAYRTKVIVLTEWTKAEELCGRIPPERQSGEIFIDPRILYNAVSASQQVIEEALDIRVIHIEAPETKTH